MLRLVTGEQCLATLIHETADTIVVENPIAVKTISVNTEKGTIEKTITSLFCGLSDDKEYVFDRHHVVYCKRLDLKVVDYYKRLVESFDNEEIDHDEPDEDDLNSFIVIPDEQLIH